jgi:hypothetical protein
VPTRRPHYVPRTYLRAWANQADQVSYRRRDRTTAVVTNITNVAVRGGIYGEGELGEAREVLFQQVEEEWDSLRSELIIGGDLGGERRSLLAVYAAIQLNRTAKHGDQMNFICNVAASTDERPIPKSAVREYLTALDGSGPDDGEVEAAWTFIAGAPGIATPDEMLSVGMDVAVTQIAPRLELMRWRVEKFPAPVLLTSDCPVMAWRRPDPDRPVGGVGIETADEVRFPLSPSALLVMTKAAAGASSQPAQRRARSVNRETCRACHQFVVATAQSRSRLDNVELSPKPPRIRFRMLNDDIVHMYAG